MWSSAAQRGNILGRCVAAARERLAYLRIHVINALNLEPVACKGFSTNRLEFKLNLRKNARIG